ncbi:pro-neuregulin-2, membrane-bound isoform-like [Styela clava]
MYNVIVLSLFFQAAIAVSRDSCTSSRTIARYVNEIQTLGADDILLEGKYVSMSDEKFRFTVTHTWTIHNGGLKDGAALYVNKNADMKECFDELTFKEKYMLLLQKTGEPNLFNAKLAPLSLKKRGHREQLWDMMCELPENNCSMTISSDVLPPVIQLFPEMNSFLRCRVKSRSRITEIRWLKDSVDIEEEGGEVYAANGVFVRGPSLRSGTSDLVVFHAHRMHSGIYSCVAKNAGGETVQLKTRLAVGSLSEAFEPCPSSAAHYCQHGAKCNAVRGFPKEIFCECKPGYKGARCGDATVPDVEAVSSNEKALHKQVYELRIALVAVISALVVATLVCTIVVIAFVRFRRKKSYNSTTCSSQLETENGEITPLKVNSDLNISPEKTNKVILSYEMNGDNGSIRSQRQRFKSLNFSDRELKMNGHNSPQI